MLEQQPCLALLLPYPLDPLIGGVQRITWQLGHYFAECGWRVVYISLAAQGHCQPTKGTLEHPARNLGKRIGSIRAFLEQVIIRHQPDVVINQMALSRSIGTALWEVTVAGRRCNIVACYHNSPALYLNSQRHILDHQLRKWPLLGRLVNNSASRWLLRLRHRVLTAHRFRQTMKHCHRLVLLSPTFFEELRIFVPEADSGKVRAIANGFPLPTAPSLDAKRNRLLFVGRMNNLQKNVFLLPELWARLHPLLPDWELHLVGDGQDLVELKTMFAKRNVPQVIFHGRQDPAAHYRAARIFLMISAYEGFGNTLIEAQAHGVVPVAFDTYSALRWILRDGTDAKIVPACDVAALVETILELASDTDQLITMGLACVENARRFSEASVGTQWEEVFEQIGLTSPGMRRP